MDIIVSHQLTDLDGLGAMVAANKLYPDAKAVFVGRLHRTVKDFLVLYKDELETYTLDEVNIDEVERVIMVDTYKKEMTGDLYQMLDWDKCQVVVYDHHPHEKEDWITLDMSQDLGSATTILVNRIVAEDLKLNPFEATVCALAIYADTGNLTHLNTTPSDARALAYLLEADANLKVISDFIKQPLNRKQEQLLEELIKNREDLHIDGINISLFPIIYDKYVTGINRVTEQIKRLYHLDNLFIIFLNKNKAQIIGRSSDEAVDVGKICSILGGGGHSGAAAARIQGLSLEKVKKELLEVIQKNVQPLIRIKEIMTSPVRTISPDTSIEKVEELMKKYGHNGFVVMEDGLIKGIFSRGDLSKVKGHNLMHAPVKAYMTKDPVSIDPTAPVSKARDLMVKFAVGRLPVKQKDRLLGIVTRSDLLSAYYGGEIPYKHKHIYGSSMVEISRNERDISHILEKLPVNTFNFLKKAGEVADKNRVRAFLIGGLPRDLLLNEENRDLDIVIDGALDSYVSELATEFDGEWTYNSQFRTGSIILPAGLKIDLAATRKEIYQYTGALPEVEASDILEDLFRRDYTVNVLAVKLNSNEWGLLLDYFNGERDLKAGLLRILHRFSFLDDPTRIIRGIRLAVKLDFSFEEETSSLLKEAITTADFSRLSVERVFNELELLFQNKITLALFQYIKKYSIFKLLNIKLEIKDDYLNQARNLEVYLEEFAEKNYNIEEWILRMAIFTEELDEKVIDNWNIRSSWKNILLAFSKYKELLVDLGKNLEPFQIVNILVPLSNGEVIILLLKAKGRAKENIYKYLVSLQKVEISINGNDLKKLGLKPGPVIKEILADIYKARLEGDIKTRPEQLAYAEELIRNELLN